MSKSYRPIPPWRDFDDTARSAQLSEWLRVPWTKTWRLTYSGTTSSTSYTDMPSPSATMTFKKLRDDTRLTFNMQGSFYGSDAGALLYIAIGLNGVDTAIAGQFVNPASTHIPIVGMVDIDDIPRGTYTFKLRWAYGYYTCTVDSNDFFGVQVTETSEDPDR